MGLTGWSLPCGEAGRNEKLLAVQFLPAYLQCYVSEEKNYVSTMFLSHVEINNVSTMFFSSITKTMSKHFFSLDTMI